ncbi:DUF927 domain-containing protein [Nocardiopsis nanhaiensis]
MIKTSSLDTVRDALENAGSTVRGSGAQLSAICPSHEDHAASLSVGHQDGKVLLNCHAGCDSADIVHEIGLTMADLFDEDPEPRSNGRPKVVAKYPYVDEGGQVLFEVRRYEPGFGKDERKTFRPYLPKADKSGIGNVRRVLYRLPEIITASQDGIPIYITEGEKDCDRLAALGYVATTNVGGAGPRKWKEEYSTYLNGADVVIVADNDDPGRKHARAIQASVSRVAKSVDVRRPAVDHKGADLCDHLAAGHTLDDLLPLEEEDEEEPEAVPTADPEPTDSFDYSGVFGLPARTETPNNYRVNHGGVFVKRLVGGNVAWARFAFSPLAMTATFEDPDGNQYVELSWTDHTLGSSRTISRIVSRHIIRQGRKLIEQLGAAGLPVIEGDARAVERWLAEFEAANRGQVPSEKLARWLGWQDDGSFVASPDEGIKVDVAYEETRGPARSHRRKGTVQGWQDTIATLENYPVPRVVLAAAFAAPLLRALGLNSFTVDVSSRSTKGKTTALQIAGSVWFDPSEHANAMSNWRSTLYSIEKRLNLVRGIPAIFDETMAVADDKIIDEVLYQVPMNHGKARSGGAFGNMLPWETILLSSGERPALSFTTSQGAAARILGTTIAPFGDNGGPTAFAAREGVTAHHGHAGPEFVRYLQERLSDPGGRDALRKRHKELSEQLKGDSDMTARRAPMVAALVLAEITACRIGLLPYEAMPLEQWEALFSTPNRTDDRPEMAMDVLREYVAGHSGELFPGNDRDSRQPAPGWLGVRHVDDSGECTALLPDRVRKILENSGYSLEAVIGGWLDSGYLKTRENQRPAHLIPKRFAGTRVKCLFFTEDAIELSGSGSGS